MENIQKTTHSDVGDKKVLLKVLYINLLFFFLEVTTGFIAHSIGLIADSLDMLADVAVYGLSLLAIGGVVAKKRRIASMSGYLQITLAMFGFVEVIRRFVSEVEVPSFHIMIIISILALIGNSITLYLLQRARCGDINMKASLIFTSTDVMANIGIITAGILVYLTDSKLPDLIVGTLVFCLVARGAIKILRLAKH